MTVLNLLLHLHNISASCMSGRERTIDEQSRVGEQEHTQVIAYYPSKRPYLPLKRALSSFKRALSSLTRALSSLKRARVRERYGTQVG